MLYIASQNAHPEAVVWLLEQGLKPNEASGYGQLPLFLLARKGFSCGYLPRKGDIYRTAQALLDGGGNVLCRDSNGRFCYHHAAQAGNVEFLRALAERGVKLNKADREGNTGLHLIAQSCYNPLKNLEYVNREIEEKRNEDSLPVKQRSPISMEELQQRKKAIEGELDNLFRCAVILLDTGVDPEAENNMLETAQKLAVRAGAKKLAALLDGSYSPDEENSAEGQEKIAAGGMTLHQAVRKGDEEAVRALAAMGEDLNEISEQETFEGLSPLAVTCQTCNIQMASLLLELGADPTQKNGVGEQPIVALFGPQIMLHTPRNLYRDRLTEQLVALLAQYGFDPDSSLNDEGDCLLGLACASMNGRGVGRDSVIDMVVEEAIRLGADVNRKNDAGQTPLMLSCTGNFRTMEEVQTALLVLFYEQFRKFMLPKRMHATFFMYIARIYVGIYLLIGAFQLITGLVSAPLPQGTELASIILWFLIPAISAALALLYYKKLVKISSEDEDNDLFIRKEEDDNNIFKDLGF